jgi:hypothetical protein
MRKNSVGERLEMRAAYEIINTVDVKIIPLYFYVASYCISFINKHVTNRFLIQFLTFLTLSIVLFLYLQQRFGDWTLVSVLR